MSTGAVHGNVERCANLAHPVVAEPSETLDVNRDGYVQGAMSVRLALE